MSSFGEKLFNVGFAQLLLFDEISAALPELHYFFEKINKHSKSRTYLFSTIGVRKNKKKYESSPIKLCKPFLKAIGVEIEQGNRRRISGKEQSPFKVNNSELAEVRALVLLRDRQGVVRWFNTRFEETRPCGVYQILHKPTGQFYLGSSSKINSRLKNHLYCLRKGTNSNQELQILWNESVEEDFSFEVLKLTTDYKSEEKKLIAETDKNFLLNRQGNDLFQREVTITKKAKGAGD
jgi:predicted GIY-YIG superfamily endonuclease